MSDEDIHGLLSRMKVYAMLARENAAHQRRTKGGQRNAFDDHADDWEMAITTIGEAYGWVIDGVVVTPAELHTRATAQGRLIRDLIRETDHHTHETRDDGQILFVVRRLLSVSSQQSYLDMAARDEAGSDDTGLTEKP